MFPIVTLKKLKATLMTIIDWLLIIIDLLLIGCVVQW